MCMFRAAGITAGEQTGSGRSADSAGDVEVCETPAFPGHLVEDGRAVFGGAEAADVAVAHVIHIDEDKVGFARGCMGD